MIKDQFVRNLGIMTEDEVMRLQDTTVAIAGCGCIGGFSAELLVRMGVGRLVLSDPDVFDITNINRQCAATHLTVGQPKVEALRDHLLAIHPELDIELYSNGIHEENAVRFTAGADYVIDAIDYFSFASSLALHRAARAQNIHVITAVALGFGTAVLTFAPDGMTLEEYLGLPGDLTMEQASQIVFPAGLYSPRLPRYATEDKIRTWLEQRTIPTISVGQALGPGVLVSKLVLHLLGRQEPTLVPDSFQLQFES